MALNINIEKRTKDVTYFGDIRRGEFFLFGGKVFVKLEEFFITDEIITELEYQHDLQHEYDIDSDRYNCWLVGSECDYRSFDRDTIVERIDIEMNVRYTE
jgi:hypothetical protein